jgi:hypothetical protein
LAKVLGAGITALTVLEPFHVSAFEPSMVEQYKKHVAAVAAKHLDAASSAASDQMYPAKWCGLSMSVLTKRSSIRRKSAAVTS